MQPQGHVHNPYAQPAQGHPAAQPHGAQPQAQAWPGQQQQQAQAWPGQQQQQQQAQAWPGQQQQQPQAQAWPGPPQQQQQAQAWPGQPQQQPQQAQAWPGPQQQQQQQQQAQAWPGQPQQQPQAQAWPGPQQQPQWPAQQPQQQPQQAWGQQPNPYAPAAQEYDDPDAMACDVSTAARAKFIERTYLHLALAISVFVVLSAVAQNIPGVETLVGKMIGYRYSWGVVLALFCGAGYVADRWAANSASSGMQYAGLMLYTLAEVIIFIPMIYLVKSFVGIQPILTAGAATLAVFAGLTAYVFITKKDFSFIKGTLTTVSMAALGLIVASIVWGFSLGMVFSAAMIVLGAGYILYYTSNILKHYRTTQHVAAALALFSALAFVFWYVLRIILSMARN